MGDELCLVDVCVVVFYDLMGVILFLIDGYAGCVEFFVVCICVYVNIYLDWCSLMDGDYIKF
jgi:hypothetical protein